MNNKHKMDEVPLPEVPLAAELVFEKKDGKVPMTPGVKEAPKGTCHLHFLLSPGAYRKSQKRAIPTPVGLVSVRSLGEPIISDLNCFSLPPFPCHSESSFVTQARLSTFWSSYQCRPIKPGRKGKFFKLPFSNNKKAQEFYPGSQAILLSLLWVTHRLC